MRSDSRFSFSFTWNADFTIAYIINPFPIAIGGSQTLNTLISGSVTNRFWKNAMISGTSITKNRINITARLTLIAATFCINASLTSRSPNDTPRRVRTTATTLQTRTDRAFFHHGSNPRGKQTHLGIYLCKLPTLSSPAVTNHPRSLCTTA